MNVSSFSSLSSVGSVLTLCRKRSLVETTFLAPGKITATVKKTLFFNAPTATHVMFEYTHGLAVNITPIGCSVQKTSP